MGFRETAVCIVIAPPKALHAVFPKPRLLEFHLHNLHDSPEYASAPALPQALSLGFCSRRRMRGIEQRSMGRVAQGHWQCRSKP